MPTKTIKDVPWWGFLLGLLFLANLLWSYCNWREGSDFLRFKDMQIKVVAYHTNNWDGIGVIDANSKKPLWAERDSDSTNGNEVNYYFRGTNVFNIYWKDEGPRAHAIKLEARFYGVGKSVTWWSDRWGGGSFTERVSYDTNGNLSNNEVWYNQAWHTVDRRDEKNGIIIDGKWRQLGFDTNGNWTIR